MAATTPRPARIHRSSPADDTRGAPHLIRENNEPSPQLWVQCETGTLGFARAAADCARVQSIARSTDWRTL
jgi:hypothetical protein